MIEITARPGKPINLGRRGENRARCIVFDISEWRRAYGEGTVYLLHRRKGDESPYPVAVEMNGEKACWVVGCADVDCPGSGALELQYRKEETIVKSVMFHTCTWRSLGEEGPEPDEPQQNWVEQMLKAVQGMRSETADLKAGAETAAQQAGTAQTGAVEERVKAEAAAERAEAAAEEIKSIGGFVGAADWSVNDPEDPGYVKNRTHWVEENAPVEVLAPSHPRYDETQNAFVLTEGVPALSVGVSYTVNWNGAEYVCTAQDAASAIGMPGAVGLGNGSLFGLESNGEPFGMVVAPMGETNTALILPFDETTEITVSITTLGEVIHQLDPKYIKDMYYSEEGEPEVVLPERTLAASEDGREVALDVIVPLEAGAEYVVTWNGSRFSCVGKDASAVSPGAVALGDIDLLMGTGSTGEPFLIATAAGLGTMVAPLDGSSTFTLSVLGGAKEIVHTIPSKYLGFDMEWTAYSAEVSEIMPEKEAYSGYEFDSDIAANLVIGKEIIVGVDGTLYRRKVGTSSLNGMTVGYVGNLAALVNPQAAGDPFLIVGYDKSWFVSFADGERHQMGLYDPAGTGLTVHNALPDQYLSPKSKYVHPSYSKAQTGLWLFSVDDTGHAKVDRKVKSSDIEDLSEYIMNRVKRKAGWAVDAGEVFTVDGEEVIAQGHGVYFNSSANVATGEYATAFGDITKALGQNAFALGQHTTATGEESVAQGYHTVASGDQSHAQGYYTVASGDQSHAEGWETVASGPRSHAEGQGTIASQWYQHVQGKYNVEDTEDKYIHIVGNGTGDDKRSNAHTLDFSGNAWFAGGIELTSPNGTRYRFTVSDNGTLGAMMVTQK